MLEIAFVPMIPQNRYEPALKDFICPNRRRRETFAFIRVGLDVIRAGTVGNSNLGFTHYVEQILEILPLVKPA